MGRARRPSSSLLQALGVEEVGPQPRGVAAEARALGRLPARPALVVARVLAAQIVEREAAAEGEGVLGLVGLPRPVVAALPRLAGRGVGVATRAHDTGVRGGRLARDRQRLAERA